MRASGVARTIALFNAAGFSLSIGVSITPGWIELTRMRSDARSSAAHLVIPRSAHLVVAYASMFRTPRNPAPDEMLMIEPPPDVFIAGATARMPRNGPR